MNPIASTLQDLVLGLDHETRGMTFGGADDTPTTYAELAERARGLAGAFVEAGHEPGERVILVLPDERQFVEAFFGAVAAGLVPVPLFPPFMLGQLDSYLSHARRIIDQCECRTVVTIPEIAELLVAAGAKGCTSLDDLEPRPEVALPRVNPDDMAFIQYTSGSTSDPKGVVNTHRCLLDNVVDFAGHMALDPERDRGVTWLPLYHDMGLIGGVMLPVLLQGSVWYLAPLEFARHPTSWCDLLHEVRGTTTFAPNFAYGLVTRRATDDQLNRWDLSCLRVAGCAAEPIRPDVLRTFERRFARAGLQDTALLPCYGLAEATLGVTLSDVNGAWSSLLVDAEHLRSAGEVVKPKDGDEALEIVSCGSPLPSYRVRIVGADGDPVREDSEGEVEIQTPCLTSGYYRDPEATQEAISDGWLSTGDLGFLHDGELYVTGRSKDLLIVRGRNIHPQDIEWCAAEVEGVRPGNVVACPQLGDEEEEIVIVLEGSGRGNQNNLSSRVAAHVRSQCRVPVADIVVLEKGTLPKTTSGKLRRRATREAYERGELMAVGVV